MRCPRNDGGREQGTQAGDNSDPDCENDVVHRRFFFETRTIASLVPRNGLGLLDLRRMERVPVISDPATKSYRAYVNPVPIDYRVRFPEN